MDRYWPEETAGEPAPPGYVEGEWCWSHMTHEPGTGYLRCYECGHLYKTGSDLVKAYRAASRGVRVPMLHKDQILPLLGMPKPSLWASYMDWVRRRWNLLVLSPKRVYFCQECLHDF